MSSHATRIGTVGLSAWFFAAAGSYSVLGQAQECATNSPVQVLESPCFMGECDHAVNRDAWNVGTGSIPIPVRVKIHVFDNEILVLPEAERNDRINGQVQRVVNDFAGLKIALQVSPPVLYQGSPFATVGSWTAVADMKSAHAQSPATQVNVYVTNLTLPYLGASTYPWESNATTAQGGIIIDGSAFAATKTTLTHEIGHSLGLWHSYHGNDKGELYYHGGGCTQSSDACDCTCHEEVNDPDCNQ